MVGVLVKFDIAVVVPPVPALLLSRKKGVWTLKT